MLSLVAATLTACGKPEIAPVVQSSVAKSEGDSRRVLVVMNESDTNSVRIASYYLQKRKISRDQLVSLKTSSADDISPEKYQKEIEAPMYIGGKEIRTGKLSAMYPPHEHAHVLGHFHAGDATHVSQAIEAALKIRKEWEETMNKGRAVFRAVVQASAGL